MPKSDNLVIVESPAKAKTIEGYLGSDWLVKSSIGHIRGIITEKDAKAQGILAIDTDNGFKTTYALDADKKKIVNELKQDAKAAQTVWLATDEDREGEAIAWHLCEALGLDEQDTKRIVFHEITKDAIDEAVKNPRQVDMRLVEAQQARQILDRLVGFELSPVIWQKVPGGKSAGRVQSPAVRLLVEKEREIRAAEPTFTYKVTAQFVDKTPVDPSNATFKASLPKNIQTQDEAKDWLNKLIGAAYTVAEVEQKPGASTPGAPFTTSSLQQEANSKLGFSVKTTMRAAQALYQAGKITYMRTDSVNLSDKFLGAAASYIKSEFGDEYYEHRTFASKSANAQEAHEAIRPSDVSVKAAGDNDYERKLYELIWSRAVASQMTPAAIEKTLAKINISTVSEQLEAKGEVVAFAGYLKVYNNRKKDELLPTLEIGEELQLSEMLARQTFDRPPARYTEGSLVKELEKLGIGRPSTYATIIDTIQTRGYAIKGESEGEERTVIELRITVPDEKVTESIDTEKSGATKGKLIPTPLGELIADFLAEHFAQIVDYDFTARIEERLDKIAANQEPRNELLEDFYRPFHQLIVDSGDIDRSKVSQTRVIGTDPISGAEISARFTRYGPALQKDTGLDEKGKQTYQFAPMPKDARIDDVTLEQALEMFKLPRELGKTDDGFVLKANIGRFGPYIVANTKPKNMFISIKDPLDPFNITLEQAKDLYAAKLKAEAEKFIADLGEGIQILNGRYGPYVTDGKLNATIGKDTDAKSITLEQAKELLAEKSKKKTGTGTISKRGKRSKR